DFSASNSSGRFISAMHSSANNDTGGTNSIIPLLRNSSTNGFSSVYASDTSSNRTDYTCGVTCEDQPFTITSLFESENDTTTRALLKGNGQIGTEKTGIDPGAATPPYTFAVNQIYYGGVRSGAMPGSGNHYLNGDFAEIAIYDRALTCREIEVLEEYFRAKW